MLQANTAYAGPLIQLNAADNVLIAREGLSLGQTLSVGGVTVRLRAQVPAGHKIAARRIAQGEAIRQYDTVIGRATSRRASTSTRTTSS